MRRVFLSALLCASLAVIAAACGGGGDDDEAGTSTASGTRASGSATSRSGTPRAGGTGSPAASPQAGTTAAAIATSVAEGTPAPGDTTAADGTPAPGDQPPPAGDGEPPPGGPPTDAEATIAAEIGDDVGDRKTNAPDPPAGASIDPPTIAPPDPPGGGAQVLIDLNASEPGIQTTRDVKVGDVFRVAIVAANLDADPDIDTSLGLGSVNFVVVYDKAKLFAPTVTGGSAADRNPDFNQDIGGAYNCLPPAPVGDLDDAGGGDNDPSTGQAFLSCYTLGDAGGTDASYVIATVAFHATASGSIELRIGDFAMSSGGFVETGSCNPVIDKSIDCASATVNVQ